MRVSVSSPQNNLSISCYEPTSVLELLRSPSPVPEKPPPVTNPSEASNCISSVSDPRPLEWDDHVLRNMDWDSIMKDLGLDDESVPNSVKTINPSPCENYHTQTTLPEFTSSELTHLSDVDHHFTNIYDLYSGLNQNLISSCTATNINYLDNIIGNNFDFIEELIRAADCIDTQELQLAQVILAPLNQRLRYSQSGKPLHRAAFYFKEALHSLLSGSTRTTTSTTSSWGEIVQTIKAYKTFSGINPIPMFNHLTTNQAILELALDGSSAPLIHIIDFDIGLGGQYASLMKEMADRRNHKFLCITAVVPEQYAVETRLIEDNLLQFAQEMKLRVKIEFVLLRTFQMLSFKAFEFVNGEKTAILLSTHSISRCLIGSNVAAFLSDLRSVNPSVVVIVDSEVWMESGTTTTTEAAASFRRNFVNGLEFYAMMFESLDAAAVVVGGEWVRKIESLLFRPRILAAVEEAARSTAVRPWREAFYGVGMRALHLSQFADFQAECLLGKVPVRGFHVAKRQAELVLCWHDTALVATSAWKC